jgi:hypothetical protein
VVVATLESSPGKDTHWSRASMARHSGLSKSTIGRIWRKFDLNPHLPERRTHDYLRHGITSVFAAFNIADGTVISELHRRHRAIEFRKFPVRIDKAVPGGLEVHLVCDNYATHNTPRSRRGSPATRASTSTSPRPRRLG